jgi:hypothetical protein
MPSPEDIRIKHGAAWMALPQVIGTGIGDVEGCSGVLVFVSAHHPDHAGLPREVDGCPVRVVRTGEVKAPDGLQPVGIYRGG